MADAPRAVRDRRRTGALVLAWIALLGIGLPLIAFAVMILTLEGATSMAAVLPAGIIYLTWWLWLVLALVGLGLSAGVSRPRLPVVLSLSAGILSFVGFLLVARMFS